MAEAKPPFSLQISEFGELGYDRMSRVSRFDASEAGNHRDMRWHKRIRLNRQGLNVIADVNAAVTVNRGETASVTRTDSVSHVSVVQGHRGSRQDAEKEQPPETERREKQ